MMFYNGDPEESAGTPLVKDIVLKQLHNVAETL